MSSARPHSERNHLAAAVAMLMALFSCSGWLVHKHSLNSATGHGWIAAHSDSTGERHRHRNILGLDWPAEPSESGDGLKAGLDDNSTAGHAMEPGAIKSMNLIGFATPDTGTVVTSVSQVVNLQIHFLQRSSILRT